MSHVPPSVALAPLLSGERVNRLVTLFAGERFSLHAERLDGGVTFTHVNESSDEAIYVVAGAMSMRLGEGRVTLVEGEMQVIPKGVPHGDLVGHADLLVVEG